MLKRFENENIVLCTEAGIFYNYDRTKKTKDEDEVKSWFNNDTTSFTIVHSAYGYAGYHIDTEPENKRIKITYYNITGARKSEQTEIKQMKWEDSKGKFHECCLYIYSNGLVEGTFKEYSDSEPRYGEPYKNGQRNPLFGNRTTGYWWGYGSACCLNRHEVWYSNSFCDSPNTMPQSLIDELLNIGFPKNVYYRRDYIRSLSSYYDLLQFIKHTQKPATLSKNAKWVTQEEPEGLPKFNPNDRICFNNVSDGSVIIRMTDSDKHYSWQNKDQFDTEHEMSRIWIKADGTMTSAHRENETWTIRNSTDFSYFYNMFDVLIVEHKDSWKNEYTISKERVEKLKDLLLNHKKLKHLNDLVNKNLESLVYDTHVLLSLVCQIKKSPNVFESLINFGMENCFMVERKTYSYSNKKHACIRTFNDHFIKDTFIEINDREKDFYHKIDLTKDQWKILKDDPEAIRFVKILFLNKYHHLGDYYDRIYPNKTYFNYDKLRDVPLTLFEKAYNTYVQFKNSKDFDYYGSKSERVCYELFDYIYIRESDDYIKTFNLVHKIICNDKLDINLYKDYMAMREKLLKAEVIKEMEFPEIPQNNQRLQFLHDKLVVKKKEVENELERIKLAGLQELYAKLRTKYLKYEYSDGEYSMIVPESVCDLSIEGDVLGHCVGGYKDRIAHGDTIIIFLRKNDSLDIPYFTVNIDNTQTHILQIHGKGNRWLGTEPSVIPFVMKWLYKFNLQCTDQILLSTARNYCDTAAPLLDKPVIDYSRI